MDSNTAAEVYNRQSKLYEQYNRGMKLIDLLSITENNKVLDLGCGTGLLTKALGERVGPGGKVVGVDPDKARIQLAREKYGSSNVVFLEGSTDNFPEDQYDFVYSNYVFHWVQDKKAAFENVYKSLKPGGGFAIQCPLIMEAILDTLNNLCGEDVAREFTDSIFFSPMTVYEEAAREVGFLVYAQDEQDNFTAFPDMESLMDWWHGTTHGLFKPELIDDNALKNLKETHRSERHGKIGTLIMMKC